MTVEHVRVPLNHRAKYLDEETQKRAISNAVYQTQWFGGPTEGLPLCKFNFTRIDSDQWSRVSGELCVHDKWEEGDPEDKDEFPVVLTVSTEADVVEDGFVSIAFWLYELFDWARALNGKGDYED